MIYWPRSGRIRGPSGESCGFCRHSAAAADTNDPRSNIMFILSDDRPPDALKPG
jgi:hypothetical protein